MRPHGSKLCFLGNNLRVLGCRTGLEALESNLMARDLSFEPCDRLNRRFHLTTRVDHARLLLNLLKRRFGLSKNLLFFFQLTFKEESPLSRFGYRKPIILTVEFCNESIG